MSSSRRLAAIMFTDIAGYSALMSEDEQRALRVLSRNRKLQGDLIQEYRGEWLKEIGDGVLASFHSVVDAVLCAGAIQKALTGDPELQLRIGIHQGEVVFENGDVFGDGVNIASRIEALVPPGGIYVSAAVYHNIANKPGIRASFLDEMTLKNIGYSVGIYSIAVDEVAYRTHANKPIELQPTSFRSGWWRRLLFVIVLATIVGLVVWFMVHDDETRVPATSQINAQMESAEFSIPTGPKIAVMPFDNLSEDPEQQYFSSGLIEDIITALSSTDAVVFPYRDTISDFTTASKTIGMRYFLQGSVRRSDDEIRVTARLIDAHSGQPVWSQTYDRDLTVAGIFEIQDDIATRVVATIADSGGVISRESRSTLVRRQRGSLGAYECILRTYAFEDSHTEMDHHLARECLENVVATDSSYVDALAHLAYLYREEYQHNFNQRPNALARAEVLARQAIELDPLNQNAWYALALAHFGQGEVDAFFTAAYRAINLNPNNTRVIGGLGIHIALAGEWAKGIKLLEKTMAINPLSRLENWLHLARASVDFKDQMYKESLSDLHQASLRALPLFQILEIAAYAHSGNQTRAKDLLDQAVATDPDFVEHARSELERFYLADADLVTSLVEGLVVAGVE